MPGVGPARVLICAPNVHALADLRRPLEGHGYEVTLHLLGDGDDPAGPSRMVVLDGSGHTAGALELCRRLRAKSNDDFVPILFVTDDHSPSSRLASFEAGADTYLLRPFAAGELIAQAHALLRIKDTHDRLAEKTAEVNRVNKRLQQAYQQLDQELELAQRIQASFLPQSLPQVSHVRFAVHYALCGRVGGDFYDVFRLDEKHVGFYVADAVGHGVPASLLTIFVKKGVKAKDVYGSQYRLVPPGEVLHRLNRDLIEQQLSERPFITMVYGLLDHQAGTLRFARAGHPYPLYVPKDGEPELWRVDGLLLGVADAKYTDREQRLEKGDKLLFYTDGVDTAAYEGQPEGVASLMACAKRHRALPATEFVARLARDLFGAASQPDDLTLLALERCE